MNTRRLEERVRTRIQGLPWTICLHAKNLDSAAEFGLRSDERVRTASTIKVPIMVAAFAAVEAGMVKWDAPIRLRDADKVSGSGVLLELSDGVQLPLRDLVHLMIVVSDNTATNLVLDRLTADFVNAQMDQLGLGQTRSLRKTLGDGGQLAKPAGHSKAGLDPENKRFGLGVSTPREMVRLLEKLERGEVITAAASKEMIGILKRQQHKDCIGRHISRWEVASKSGSLDALRSDVGIVYAPGNRIAIAATLDGMPQPNWSPENAGQLLISDLTGIVLDEMRG